MLELTERSEKVPMPRDGPTGVLVPLLFAVGLLGCDGTGGHVPQSDHVVAFDTVRGTVIVRNQGSGLWAGRSEGWSISMDLEIPDSRPAAAAVPDSSSPEYILEAPVGVNVGPDGQIVVLDFGGQDLKFFDAGGRFVRRAGGPGQGPGEFDGPVGMAWDFQGRLWVVDGWNERYSVFDSTGGLVKTIPRRLGVVGFRQALQFDAPDTLIDEVPVITSDGSRLSGFVRADTTGAVLDTFPPLRRPDVVRNGSGDAFIPNFPSAVTPYLPNLVYTFTEEGEIWFARSDEFRLYRRNLRGDTLQIIEASHRSGDLTDEDERSTTRALESAGLQRNDFILGRPVLYRILVAPGDYLLVQVADIPGEDSSTFDVFDPDGRYLGPVSAPFPIDRRIQPHLSDDTLLAVSLGPLGESRIVRGILRRP